jgi:alkanesulfonate monooxygenase SsuD/methylene tetrahydromethanopterin reductase-like flavin-dependent oxidoreductase (luciferase family)
MALRFGVFDHIEPVPGLGLDRIYRERLLQIERLDAAGFHAYHLAEHHTPAIHSLAPSQNVFLAAVAQRTRRLRFGPCVYVLPLHHPLRLIEEISMLDNLSEGRLEIGVGRGGVMEAYFWGQEADPETNYERYRETLAIIREGLSHDELSYAGRFHSFEKLPMYLRPLQRPYPPLWYMRNPVTAAMEGMHTILVGALDSLAPSVARYRAAWEEHQGARALTVQGEEPLIGLVVHLVVADTDEEAIAAATPAWESTAGTSPRRGGSRRSGAGSPSSCTPRMAPSASSASARPACPRASCGGTSTPSSSASTSKSSGRTPIGWAAWPWRARRRRCGSTWTSTWPPAPTTSSAPSSGAT